MIGNQHDTFQIEWNELDTTVADSRNIWSDASRSEFDATYWQEMVQVVNHYLSALYELSDTIQYIEQNMP